MRVALPWLGYACGVCRYCNSGRETLAEGRWGDLSVPARLTVGWGFGTPEYRPFFRAEITALAVAD
jgi:hypothetical protein